MGAPAEADGVRGRAWAPVRVRASLTLAAAALVLSACLGGGAAPEVPPFDHLPVAPTMHTYHPASSIGLPVSMVQYSSETYLVCDYVNVYRVARTTTGYSVTTLARPAVPVWTPAGLDFRDETLYVANYRGQDVLALRVDGDRLTLVRRIADPQLKEPKHLRAEPDGSLVVADHFGNGVLRFRPDGSLQWRATVDQANGVTESGGFTYASSLSSRRISKIDGSGRVVSAAGSPGSALGSYLLPVDLADLGDRIAVTDAVNGRITLLDHGLHVVGHAGGNGPGLDALNYPFATLPVADGYVIADGFKQRLVHVDGSWTIGEQIALGPSVPTGRQRPLVFGSSARPSTYGMLPGVDIAAQLGLRRPLDFVGGYAGLDHVAPGGPGTHLDLGDPDFGESNATWAERVGRYVVAGSAESHLLEVIDPATGMFTYVEIGEDNWWLAGSLLTSVNLRRGLGGVLQPAVGAFDRAQRLLDEGATRQDVFKAALAGALTRDLSNDLTSTGGQQFLQSGMTKADARRYFAWAMGQRQQRVVELLAVKYLSGS